MQNKGANTHTGLKEKLQKHCNVWLPGRELIIDSVSVHVESSIVRVFIGGFGGIL
jgi:hypothetical protein